MIKGLSKKMGKKAVQEPDAPKTATEMRGNAAKMYEYIHATDLENSKLPQDVKEGDSYKVREALLYSLKNAPTISQDMTPIDDYLIKFAQLYQLTADEGLAKAFYWTENALAKGMELRKSISPGEEEFNKEEFSLRLERIKLYDTVIQQARAIDIQEMNIRQRDGKIAEDRRKVEILRDEIEDELATKEGDSALRELEENPKQEYGNWSKNARELNLKLIELEMKTEAYEASVRDRDRQRILQLEYENSYAEAVGMLNNAAKAVDKNLPVKMAMIYEEYRKRAEQNEQTIKQLRDRRREHEELLKGIQTGEAAEQEVALRVRAIRGIENHIRESEKIDNEPPTRTHELLTRKNREKEHVKKLNTMN